MNTKLFGDKLKKARKEKGMTSKDLAELCNLNHVYIRQIENGSKTPSLPVFVSLSKALNVSPSYLLEEVLENLES